MNILITAGGTREYIDGVRYIGNSSRGQTAAKLTDYLIEAGHNVVWLGAKTASRPKLQRQVESHYFETYEDLHQLLQQQLAENSFDLIFQAAAVSDYKVDKVIAANKSYAAGRDHKIPTHESLQIELSKQPKLVNSIKQWTVNKQLFVVAFKLTNSQDESQQGAAVKRLLDSSGINAVAHNDLNAMNAQKHPFTLHVKDRAPFECDDIIAVAQVLMTLWEMRS